MSATEDSNFIFDELGKINYKTEANIDLAKGSFSGVGYRLNHIEYTPIRKYIRWKTLDSHKLTTGTTRQGKSRLMMSDVMQQIANNMNVFIGEPKGSKHQEIIGYVLQYAWQYGRVEEVRYVSPYFKENSEKFNCLYSLKNEQISSLVGELIDTKEPVYKNIGKAITLAACMGVEFIEQVDNKKNPYDLIVMERIEYAKVISRTTDKLNKYVWGKYYSENKHGNESDVYSDLRENAKDDVELQKINEAIERVVERYEEKTIDKKVIPSRKFFRLKDLAQFEQTSNLLLLKDEVETRLSTPEAKEDSELLKLGQEALQELTKISSRSEDFIGKLGTSYSIVLSELINGDVGSILNDCRINPLLDELTSDERGVIIIYQPFPMIYKSASDALGKIMFSMFSMMAGYIGASGELLSRRLCVNIDEAGSILTEIVQHLANKGGGLGFSLFLYTQSIADILESLGENLTRILLDNMNTKAFFKGNDNETAREISLIMGTQKKASSTLMASDQRDLRNSSAISEEQVISESLIQRLPERSYLLKEGSDIYMLKAPFVEDAQIKVVMPIDSYGKISKDNDRKKEYIRKILK